MDRNEALALLESQHEFPGRFDFRVVVLPTDKELMVSAIAAASGKGARVLEVNERFSRGGKYVALRISVHIASAEAVLEVFDVIKGMDNVLASM